MSVLPTTNVHSLQVLNTFCRVGEGEDMNLKKHAMENGIDASSIGPSELFSYLCNWVYVSNFNISIVQFNFNLIVLL